MRIIELEEKINQLTAELNERKNALVTLLLLTDSTKITIDGVKVTLKSKKGRKVFAGIKAQLLQEELIREKEKICLEYSDMIRSKLQAINKLETSIETLFSTPKLTKLHQELKQCELSNLTDYSLDIKPLQKAHTS